MSDTPALSLKAIDFTWPGRNGFRLKISRFTVERGETVLLLGPSGSGKSTLLSMICGIVSPQKGSIRIEGAEITGMKAARRDLMRGENIGIIFQQFNLLPHATVEDNILLPLTFAPDRRRRVPDAPAEIRRLCKVLGLAEEILTKNADRLSVGQQQRVAAARAIIGRPALIVADEPTSALDTSNRLGFLDLLFEQVNSSASTLLMVSHDERLAPRFGRSVAISDIIDLERSRP